MTTSLPRRPGPSVRTRVHEYAGGMWTRHEDRLTAEEPLEIRLSAPGLPAQRIAVTMRTPGNDFELAAGWLVHEGVIGPEDIEAVRYCTDAELAPEQEFNVVTLDSSAPPRSLPAARMVNAACGVCGAQSVAEVATAPRDDDLRMDPEVLLSLPDRLRESQATFRRTGGLHAAGLAETSGELLVTREDVGRHNAVDKVVGARLLAGQSVPPVLVLSGRIGFELVQKAVVSGVSVIVAVGAPSSLAVQLGEQAGLTVAGFARGERMVVYSGAERLGG